MNLPNIAAFLTSAALVVSIIVNYVRYGSRIDNLEKRQEEHSKRAEVTSSEVHNFWDKQISINETLARFTERLDRYVAETERRLSKLENR